MIFDEFRIETGTPEDVALAVVYPHRQGGAGRSPQLAAHELRYPLAQGEQLELAEDVRRVTAVPPGRGAGAVIDQPSQSMCGTPSCSGEQFRYHRELAPVPALPPRAGERW